MSGNWKMRNSTVAAGSVPDTENVSVPLPRQLSSVFVTVSVNSGNVAKLFNEKKKQITRRNKLFLP